MAVVLGLVELADAQCPNVAPPCICAPSVYEPVGIVCDNAGQFLSSLLAIRKDEVKCESCITMGLKGACKT